MSIGLAPMSISLDNFQPQAQAVIRGSRKYANICKARAIEPNNLLASFAASDTAIGVALRAHGITPEEVLTYSTFHHHEQPAYELAFDDSNFLTNFTSSTREILVNAIINAEMRAELNGADLTISEADLFKSLTGLSNLREDSTPCEIFVSKGVQPYVIVEKEVDVIQSTRQRAA